MVELLPRYKGNVVYILYVGGFETPFQVIQLRNIEGVELAKNL